MVTLKNTDSTDKPARAARAWSMMRSQAMELVAYPDARLRVNCSKLPEGQELREAVKEMRARMFEWGGIGLAAPQCGLPWRLFVSSVGGRTLAFVDPKISNFGPISEGLEGCLSIRGVFVPVARKLSTTVEAMDEDGRPFRVELTGIEARCAQHENDHLNGVLSLDHVEGWRRRAILSDLWKSRRRV